jgi:hypothetical protein
MPVTQEVAGSNPVGPANIFEEVQVVDRCFWFHCTVVEIVGTPRRFSANLIALYALKFSDTRDFAARCR